MQNRVNEQLTLHFRMCRELKLFKTIGVAHSRESRPVGTHYICQHVIH